jgi:multimeric flavodoxin WrbA
MQSAKVVGIVGSPRKNGNTELLVNRALEIIRAEGFPTELVPLAGKTVGPCLGCDRCKRTGACAVRDDFQEVYAKMRAAAGIILGSPVYNFTTTPQLISLKIRASRMSHSTQDPETYYSGSALEKKVGGSIVVARRAGAVEATAEINNFFLCNEMFIVGSRYPNVAFAYEKGDVAKDTEGVANIERFARNFAWLLKKIAASGFPPSDPKLPFGFKDEAPTT